MRGQEGKMGWGWVGAEQEPPHPRWTLAPPTFEALPIQGAWQEFPSSPGAGKGDGGWDWSELLGEETEITLPSTHGGHVILYTENPKDSTKIC